MNPNLWTDSEDDDLGLFQIISRDLAFGLMIVLGIGIILFWPYIK